MNNYVGRGGARSGSGRPSPWQSGPTVPIRVPENLADRIYEYAKQLDSTNSLDIAQNQNSVIDSRISEILADSTITRNGKDKAAVRRALDALKVSLLEPLPGK